jgi:hypothetical protein
MTPALFPEMAQSTFKPLLGRLTGNKQLREFSADEVRELLVACDFGAVMLDKLSEMLQTLLRRGIESQKLSFFLQEFNDTIELAQNEIYARVGEIAAGQALPAEERLAAQQSLDDFRARAMAKGKELASLRQWLENPPQKVDFDSMGAGTTTQKAGTNGDIDEILVRLRAGVDV